LAALALPGPLLAQDELEPPVAPVSIRPTEAERELAVAVIPGLASGRISLGAKTATGGQALGSPAAIEPWGLLRVDPVHGLGGDEARLVIVWLVPEAPDGTVRTFVCGSCPALGVPALVRPRLGEVIATGAPLRAMGQDEVRFAGRLEAGKRHIEKLRRISRHAGVVREEFTLLQLDESRISNVGTLTVHYSNEGSCGRLAEVIERGQPYRRDEMCATVFRYTSEIERVTKDKVFVQERLQWARPAKGSKQYEAQEPQEKLVHYTLGARGWRLSGRSLLALVQ
jgi:hypothetical protein